MESEGSGGGRVERVESGGMTVKDLVALVERRLRLNGCSSIKSMPHQAKPLLRALGSRLAEELKPSDFERYKDERLAAGAARQTVNHELGILGRGFAIAMRQELLTRAPRIDKLKVTNARQGFLDPAPYRRLVDTLQAMSPVLADVVRFCYLLGWRRGETLGLTWDEVDVGAGILQLCAERAKNRNLRTVAMPSDIIELLRRRALDRNGPLVFHRHGKEIRDFSRRWKKAVWAIGRPALLLHDTRRSFARNGTKLGIPRRVLMEIGGWRSESMFNRYAILDEAQQAEALERIGRYAEGTPAAQGAPIVAFPGARAAPGQ